ncbi:MAG: DUF2889 domain-containing protein [Halobacteriota archaeon]|nr:DUF2889 domain-containing protein [Halobacteriota archaeon]
MSGEILTFSRSKVVGVERRDKKTFLAHGALDDNIYSMEIDLEVKLPDFEITKIEGVMKRVTTEGCEKAIPKLQEAIGMRIGEDEFARKVRRIIGRGGCSHFANLILECSDAIVWNAAYGDWDKAQKKGMSKADFKEQMLGRVPMLKNSCMAHTQRD